MRSKVKEFLTIPALWGVGILLFLPLLRNRFIGDDYTALSIHRAFRHAPFFKTLLYGGNDFFRPVNMALVMARGEVFGPNPVPFVIFNIVFHLINATLVFLIARKLFDKTIAAIGSAVLFLVTFCHYEGITWISSSITLLVTFFVLISFFSHINFRRTGKLYWVVTALLAFVLAFLTKETAVSLPFLILVYDLFFSTAEERRRFRFYSPYLIYGLLFIGYILVQTQWALRFASAGDSIYRPGWHVITNIVDYWVWFWMPNPRHPYVADVLKVLPQPLLISYWVLAGIAVLSLILVIVLAALKRLSRPLLFSFLATFISLLIFLPFAIKISTRYAYLPSAFFVMFAAGLFTKGFYYLKERGKRVLKILLSVVAGLYLGANTFAILLVQKEFVKVSTLTEQLALQAGDKVDLENQDVIFIEGLPSHIHLREAIQWFHNPTLHVHADNDMYRGTPLTLEDTRKFFAGSEANLHHFIFSADSLILDSSQPLAEIGTK
ncbi:glycosyltransferase family 39 protein [candidate division WOR-3 bacterium]|nr:glycosyltransferase family 39 protein [candidate division WOR-3 bacterium]